MAMDMMRAKKLSLFRYLAAEYQAGLYEMYYITSQRGRLGLDISLAWSHLNVSNHCQTQCSTIQKAAMYCTDPMTWVKSPHIYRLDDSPTVSKHERHTHSNNTPWQQVSDANSVTVFSVLTYKCGSSEDNLLSGEILPTLPSMSLKSTMCHFLVNKWSQAI